MRQYILIKAVFLFVSLSFFCQIAKSMDCLSANIIQKQFNNHLNVKYLAWDGGVAGYQRVHGLPSRNGYYLLGIHYNTWEIMPEKKPLSDVLSVEDAKNKVREGLATLSEGVFVGFRPAGAGRSSGTMMKCSYKANINGDVLTIDAEGWEKD